MSCRNAVVMSTPSARPACRSRGVECWGRVAEGVDHGFEGEPLQQRSVGPSSEFPLGAVKYRFRGIDVLREAVGWRGGLASRGGDGFGGFVPAVIRAEPAESD
jgi:hypothetical protein